MERVFSPEKTVITRAKIFERAPEKKYDIIIEDGLIQDIIPSEKNKKYKTYKIIDLKGDILYPGFNDGHTHFIQMGLSKLKIDLTDSKSVDDVYEKVRSAVKNSEKGKPLVGQGYDESKWTARGMLNKQSLDEIAPENPVVLRRICGHRGVANEKALEKIPFNWEIVNRETGELLEDAVLYIRKIFPPAKEELYRGLEYAIEMAKKKGVTSVSDIVNRDYWKIYQRYFSEKKPEIRVNLYPVTELLYDIINSGMESGWGNEYLRLGGVKIFTDGSIGAYTAAINKKYRGKNTKGVLIHKNDVLEKLIRDADSNNLQLMIHAIGDRAIDQILGIFEKIDYKRQLRHRLEHVELIREDQIEKCKELGLVLSMQPNFVGEWGAPGGMYEKRLPPKYYTGNNPIKTVLDKEVPLAFGSDSMPFGPLYGIESAVSHPCKNSRITLNRAITAYTMGSAFAEHCEGFKGKIEPGYAADLVYDLPF